MFDENIDRLLQNIQAFLSTTGIFDLKIIFSKLDRDNDGLITKKDLTVGGHLIGTPDITSEESGYIMKLMNPDNFGNVSVSSFEYFIQEIVFCNSTMDHKYDVLEQVENRKDSDGLLSAWRLIKIALDGMAGDEGDIIDLLRRNLNCQDSEYCTIQELNRFVERVHKYLESVSYGQEISVGEIINHLDQNRSGLCEFDKWSFSHYNSFRDGLILISKLEDLIITGKDCSRQNNVADHEIKCKQEEKVRDELPNAASHLTLSARDRSIESIVQKTRQVGVIAIKPSFRFYHFLSSQPLSPYNAQWD